MSESIAERFPNVAAWIEEGWVELGPSEWSSAFVRVMLPSGAVWEGEERYDSIEVALADAERAIEDL